MNESTLILTEHRLAPRLFDAALTLIAREDSCFSCTPLWMQLTEEGDHRWNAIIASFNTVLVYLLIAAFNGWLLILWYQYNRRAHVRRRHPEMLRHDELAQSFNVTPQIMSEMSQYNLLTVYHDQIGRIIDLKISEQQDEKEEKSPAGYPAGLFRGYELVILHHNQRFNIALFLHHQRVIPTQTGSAIVPAHGKGADLNVSAVNLRQAP